MEKIDFTGYLFSTAVSTMCFNQVFKAKLCFHQVGKKIFTSKYNVSTGQKYVSATKKIVFTVKKICFQQRDMYFHYQGKQFLQPNICVSTSRKCVSTTCKNSFYRYIYVFPPTGKIGFTSKNMCEKNVSSHYWKNYNHGNNIVGLFDALPNFSFTASETKCDYQ